MRKRLYFAALIAIALFFLSEAYFNFPVMRRIIPALGSPSETLAARISGHPITRSQLDRALSERLWLEGKSTASATPAELQTARAAALEDLIDHELLRLEVNALAPQMTASDEEIHERLRRLVGRFENKGALETAMKSQGIPTEQDLRARLAARIQQEKFIALKIGPSIKVSEEEARKWFEANPQSAAIPERIEARHIFLPTLDRPPEEAKQKLDAALAELNGKKKDFPTLARELSEDPATRETGGALGWMTRGRLPADFAAPVFSLTTNTPTLVRTRLGWHLVEVTARKPAGTRTFEEAKSEILAALEAVKRSHAIGEFRKSLRTQKSAEIEILPVPPASR